VVVGVGDIVDVASNIGVAVIAAVTVNFDV